MAKTISPNEFANAVNSILSEYKGVVDEQVELATQKTAERAAANVTSNINQTDMQGKKYRKSIRTKKLSENAGHYSSTVYARPPYYRLTHLLENGHATRNGGRTRAFPHWAEAEQKAIRDYEALLRRELE